MSTEPTPAPIPEPPDAQPLSQTPPEPVRSGQEERLLRAWRFPSGWRYLSEVNNTAVGAWYMAAAFFFLLFGGVLALLMRIQLAVPGNGFLSAEKYNQIFTMHGTVMMFLFAIPIFEAFSIFVLPQMLGTRDLPFPRLSAYGFWSFALGGLFFCASLFFDAAPRGGWFMYPPLTTKYQPDIGADFWLLGLSFIEIAAIAAAVELIVGVLKGRPPGMRLNLIPLYAWYMLVAAVMVLFAFPPVIAGSLLLEIERAFHWPFFDPAKGGDPLLWQHLFWLFGHPEVYVIFLPSVAIAAMIVPTFSRRPIVGYGFIVLAAVGTGFLSFGLWVHHMFTTGLPGISLALFSAASQAVAIPTGIQLFCFIATLAVGRVTRSVPMLFILGGLGSFVFGGLTGVMVALAPFDLQAHDTFFIVGHLHYVLIGGSIFPVLGGVYYFFPLLGGKMLSARLGRIAFWILLVGFQVTFMPMHLAGLRGMPRRVFTYPAGLGFDGFNLVSSIGAFILGVGFLIVVVDILRPRKKQPIAKRNPWDAGTLEWLPMLPDKPWGVRSIPEIDSRYPLWDQPDFVRHVDEGRFYLPDAEEGLRETLVTSVVDARPQQCLRVAGPSFIPLFTALFTGGAFIFATFHLWKLAAVSTVLAIASIVYWLWSGTAIIPEKERKDIGLGVEVPLYVSGSGSVGWWAMFITLLADVTAFVCLLFGYFYYWTIHRDFASAAASGPGVFWPVLGGGLLLATWALTILARRANRHDRAWVFYAALAFAVALAVAGSVALLAGPLRTSLDPTSHVYPAIVWLLVLWCVVHVGVGVIMQIYCVARRLAGRMTARHDIDITNVTLYWHFTAITVALTTAVIAGFPRLA